MRCWPRKGSTSPPTGRFGRFLSPCWCRSHSWHWGWPSGSVRSSGGWRWSTRRSSSRSAGRSSSAPRQAPCPICRPPCSVWRSATPRSSTSSAGCAQGRRTGVRDTENTMARPTGESNTATRIAQDGGKDVDGKNVATETGTFLGEFPYVRFGSGPENLVILPGITLDNEPPNRFAAWTYRLGFGRFAWDYAVYVINRRRGMPSGYTTEDMAADYAAVLEQELGPSHLMGFSTGGEIAQYVAIDHSASVRSLTLVVSACRLSEAGRGICERWQTLAREGRWRELRADMASVNVTSETNKRLARAFMAVFRRIVLQVA